MKKAYGYASISIILGALGQLLFKYAVLQLPESVAVFQFYRDEYWPSLLFLAGGVVSYGVATLLWILALRELPLSQAYPLLALSYPIVSFAAVMLPLFSEESSFYLVTGLVVISLGVYFAAMPDPAESGKKQGVNDGV